jgi:hypothetical protein
MPKGPQGQKRPADVIGKGVGMSKRTTLSALAAIAVSAPAQAAVVISTAATQNMNCAGGTCTPTATKAVLNASDLESYLSQFGNVAGFTTPDSTSLALDAHKAITADAAVSIGSGTAEFELQSDTLAASDTLSFGKRGHITFGSLSDIFGINGDIFTLVGSVHGLASAVAANPSGAFALANSYDAKADGIYATTPIPTKFEGVFEGLGNTISHLTIEDTSSYDVGFFGETDTPSLIENILLTHLDVSGTTIFDVGGLVAFGLGTIRNASADGKIAGPSAEAGALVGINAGLIAHSHAHCAVSGGYAGGLAGENGGTISDSYANGSEIGGLMGGLTGVDDGLIEDSYSTGAVTAAPGDEAGGIAGSVFAGTIERSYATGAVSGGDGSYVGGVTGYIDGGTVDQSFSTGAVSTGKNGAAGEVLAGMCSCEAVATVTNVYAVGSVKGKSGSLVGGLAGFIQDNEGSTITAGYSAGTVEGPRGDTGGFIGFDDNPGDIAYGYWDLTTSGITNPSRGAGNVKNDPGIVGLTDAQLKSGLPQGFNPKIWAEDPNINNGLPYLINNPPPK